MNDAIKEVRATLEQARDSLRRLPRGMGSKNSDGLTRDTLACLTNAIDVLTGEVERLDTNSGCIAKALAGMVQCFVLVQKQIKVLTG